MSTEVQPRCVLECESVRNSVRAHLEKLQSEIVETIVQPLAKERDELRAELEALKAVHAKCDAEMLLQKAAAVEVENLRQTLIDIVALCRKHLKEGDVPGMAADGNNNSAADANAVQALDDMAKAKANAEKTAKKLAEQVKLLEVERDMLKEENHMLKTSSAPTPNSVYQTADEATTPTTFASAVVDLNSPKTDDDTPREAKDLASETEEADKGEGNETKDGDSGGGATEVAENGAKPDEKDSDSQGGESKSKLNVDAKPFNFNADTKPFVTHELPATPQTSAAHPVQPMEDRAHSYSPGPNAKNQNKNQNKNHRGRGH